MTKLISKRQLAMGTSEAARGDEAMSDLPENFGKITETDSVKQFGDAFEKARKQPPASDAPAQPPCSLCGGPHPFDTTVPSVRWNEVIRAAGLPDYLCLTCIVRVFVEAGQSFTADLVGGPFHCVPIEIRVRSKDAIDAQALSEENNKLRARLNAAFAATDEVALLSLLKGCVLLNGSAYAGFVDEKALAIIRAYVAAQVAAATEQAQNYKLLWEQTRAQLRAYDSVVCTKPIAIPFGAEAMSIPSISNERVGEVIARRDEIERQLAAAQERIKELERAAQPPAGTWI